MALACSPAEAKPVPHTVVVVVDKLAFGAVPNTLKVGDSIMWVNRDLLRHSATSKGHFDVDLPAGSRKRMLLTRSGAFSFTCKYHPGMRGVFKVSK